jgi:hypothetical protein
VVIIYERRVLLHHGMFKLNKIIASPLVLMAKSVKDIVMWIKDCFREEDFRIFSGQQMRRGYVPPLRS